MTAPSAVLVEHVHVTSTGSDAPGASPWVAVALYVAVTGAGLLAAPALTGARGWARGRLLAAAAILGGALILTGDGGVGHTAFIAAHLVAAAIWAGGVLYLAWTARTSVGRALLAGRVGRFSMWAIGSAAALVASGYVLLHLHDIGIAALGDSGFGRIVLAKFALLLLAAVLGVVHRMARSKSLLHARPALLRVEAGALAGAVALAGVLISTVVPSPTVQLAAPGLAVVRVPDAPAEALLVTALSSDTAAVRVLSSDSVRLVDRSTDQAHQLGPGEVARVALHKGFARLALTSGLATVNVAVAAQAPAQPPADGSVTADPVSWLDYQLGRVIGLAAGGEATTTSVPGCTAPTPRHEGAGLGRELRRQHVTRVTVRSDSSSRAVDLIRGLHRAGIRTVQLSSAHAVLVATDAVRARAILTRLADKPWIRAVYLAPWLLDGRVLSLLATTRLPPLLVASTVDAMSPLADRYRATLAQIADGVPPSIAGLFGYANAIAPADVDQDRLTLYSASPVGFLPGVLDVGHDHESAGWFAGGSLVPTAAAAVGHRTSCPVT